MSALTLPRHQANPAGAAPAGNFWGLAAVVVAVLILYALLPLGTALQFGGDEGYQIITGFLWSKGFLLYKQIWDDQPPLLVLWLNWAFKIFGPSILAARLLAAGFGLILFGTFFQLVNQRAGRWAAIIATFFLVASPAILELSVSVMQEVPTFGIALVSAWLLFQWCKCPHWSWLLASGAVMGVALEIKLTAMLAVPAMIVEIVLTRLAGRNRAWQRLTLLHVLQWAVAAGIIFAVIGLIWGGGSFQSSYKSHFTEHSAFGMERPEDFSPPVSLVRDHLECILAAVAGLVLVAQQRRWRAFAFPIVLLITALVVHAIHRPWWDYYYLHLAIPLAWLAGFAVSEAISGGSRLLSKSRFNLSSANTWKGIVLCCLLAAALVRSEKRLEADVKDLRQRPTVEASPVLAKMREYGDRTHWVYVQFGKEMYPFHARLLMPPEIAMVTRKRYWSDQITTGEIVKTCRRYQIEQLLLNPAKIEDDWKGFLGDYDIVYQDTNSVLYIAKRLNSK